MKTVQVNLPDSYDSVADFLYDLESMINELESLRAFKRDSIQKLYAQACPGWAFDGSLEMLLANIKRYREGQELQIKHLQAIIREYDTAIEKLDKAMTHPDRIAQDICLVGGFVSTLNLTETGTDIVNRAIEVIRNLK